MKKLLQVTAINLAESTKNQGENQLFAIATLQPVGGKDGVSKLRAHSVIVSDAYSWLIDIADCEGRQDKDKLETARKELIGEKDEFTCITVSVEELTQGKHKGFRITDNEDYGVITTRNLVGYESEEELKSRELGRLNRQAGDTIQWVDEEEA